MKTMLAALLLLGPSPDDREAERILTAFQERVRRARTLRVRHDIQGIMNGTRFTSRRVGVELKGDSRWRIDYHVFPEGVPEGLVGAESQNLSAYYDGTKMHVVGAPPGKPAPVMPAPVVTGEAKRPLPQPLGRFGALTRSGISWLPMPEVMLFGWGMYWPDPTGTARPEGITDGGTEKIGGRTARIIRYSAPMLIANASSPQVKVALFLDTRTKLPLKRVVTIGRQESTEVFTEFSIDPEIADSRFTFQNRLRFTRARLEELAASVELFGRYTGTSPESLEDLLKRPRSLRKEIFWPESGFLLGKTVPKDPWGRPFQLSRKNAEIEIVSLGSDGKAGGEGDAEDLRVAIGPLPRQPIGAPSDRLRKHYTARVKIALLGAAARAFETTYGELPLSASLLWERPESAAFWPEGGWVSEKRLPTDPWGNPYLMVSKDRTLEPPRPGPGAAPASEPWGNPWLLATGARKFVRFQVADLQKRVAIPTADEIAALRKTARALYSEKERKELEALVARLKSGDASIVRAARMALKDRGVEALPFIEEKMKTEKDPKTLRWLRVVHRAAGDEPPTWWTELGLLARFVFPGGLETDPSGARERPIPTRLKTLISMRGPVGARLGFRRDPNATQDRTGYRFEEMKKESPGYCAVPTEYGLTGRRTFIMNTSQTVFWKDTQGKPVLEWPSDDALEAEWKRVE